MAGTGPPAKHHSIRARSNRTSTRTTLSEVDQSKAKIPALPKCIDWHPNTLAWWESVWRSPLVSEFLNVDINGLFRLAVLENNFWLEPCSKTHAEIRLAQKDFGLTPNDRRRLEWTVETAEKAKESGTQRTQAAARPAPDTGTDPRLYVV
jgi:hypothetical protein